MLSMKKLIFTFILTLGILSCNSNDDNQPEEEEVQIDYSIIIGKWNWISTCGGVTGACGYPSEEYFYTIEFKDDSSFIKIINDDTIEETSYVVTEVTPTDSYNLFHINLENGNIFVCKVENDILGIGEGSLSSFYEEIIN